MEFFIKKIFEGKSDDDEFVHLQFQKFSRGEYKSRALVKVKNSKGKYTINTTAEYAKELVRAVAEILGSNKAQVTGVVISTRDLTGELEFKGKKQFQGVKKYIIDTEMSGDDILNLCNNFPSSFVAFSFKTGDGTELKVKPKAPKSGKPSSKGGEKPKPNFCRLKTKNKDLVRGLFFDFDINNFKEADLEHVFLVEDILTDYNIKDPKEMREKAKRKGRILRKLVVDGKEINSEKAFEA